ncbi:hypothetical protein EVAR_15799_1 [Eumeta japonica]|uniref:Uncharacterized protein n=1 Tax=Eumeta variegata TaxID=151549 RepID=A0A4C1TZE1_EUMVA|nr:hypothetical protein EVAR_15799_1 [Eumeta japonica]
MNISFQYCHALKFHHESPGLCCLNEKAKLPELLQPPKSLGFGGCSNYGDSSESLLSGQIPEHLECCKRQKHERNQTQRCRDNMQWAHIKICDTRPDALNTQYPDQHFADYAGTCGPGDIKAGPAVLETYARMRHRDIACHITDVTSAPALESELWARRLAAPAPDPSRRFGHLSSRMTI